MKAALAWVRDALADSTLVDHLGCYLLKDGFIHATDGRMVVAHPFPWDGCALVNGEAFERVMKKMPVDAPTLTLTELHLIVKHKRFRGQVKILDPLEWVYPAPAGEWRPVPAGLLPACARLRPFLSENATQPWATCLATLGKHLYATNNVVLARTPVKGLPEGLMLPVWAVDFLLARGDGLREWLRLDTGVVAFRWTDGSWMRSPTIVTAFPPTCADIIRTCPRSKKGVKITAPWVEALERVASLSELTVKLGRETMSGTYGALDVADDTGTPTPPGVDFTVWNHKFLVPVVQAAHLWDPTTWPQPAYFTGDHIEGVIIGMRE